MLEYDRIDSSEGIDMNKTSAQKSVIFVTIGIFLDENFNYEPYLYNGCHDLMQKAMNFNDVAIASIKGNDYRIHFWYMSVMHNSSLNEKTELL